MTNILENLNGIAAIGIGIGMMTVVGQCLGAGRKDEAIYYIKKLTAVAEIVIIAKLCARISGDETGHDSGRHGAGECEDVSLHGRMDSVVKADRLDARIYCPHRNAGGGDVRFSMILSCISMWAFRVTLCIYLCRVHGFGPIAVWIGMFTDWTIRGIVFTFRFMGRRWLAHKVV